MRVGWKDAQAAHLGEVAQQAEGDGARAAAHLQDEGAALGSSHTGPLGHLLQHPFNQFLQGRGIWIRAGANLAPRGLGTETRAQATPVWMRKWGWLEPGPWAGHSASPHLCFPTVEGNPPRQGVMGSKWSPVHEVHGISVHGS